MSKHFTQQNSAKQVLNDPSLLPIRTASPVHRGKVRAVYWLNTADSLKLNKYYDYPLAEELLSQEKTSLGIMVISDRLSAFDCVWTAAEDLQGVPYKGAALNAIAAKWFKLLADELQASHHLLATPHPLVWIVQKTQPLRLEAIARQYLTGSLWRSYRQGNYQYGELTLPPNLPENSKLPSLWVTPSTKGVLEGLAGIKAEEDTPITKQDLQRHYTAFGFTKPEDIATYEHLLTSSFTLLSTELAKRGQIFVDTKCEFGYGYNSAGEKQLLFIDEIGTPDSSRLWDAAAWAQGVIQEHSKEGFRRFLLGYVKDPDILLNPQRLPERKLLAKTTKLPLEAFLEVSKTYLDLAKLLIGSELPPIENAAAEINTLLNTLGILR